MNLLSKTEFILFVFLLCGISIAQSKYELKMKVNASSLDDKKQIELNANGGLEGFYDGYIIFPNIMNKIQGGLQDGGFSFLEYAGIDTYFETKTQREQLAKNKVPSGNLEIFSNGLDADNVLSFRIVPEFINEEDDTVSLFIKYVLYDFDNEQSSNNKWDAKINFYTKVMRIPLNQETIIQFFDDKLSDYKLSVFLSRVKTDTDLVVIKNKKLFEAIKKTVKNCEPINEKFKFDLNFGKSNKLSGATNFLFSVDDGSQSIINLIDVESFSTVGFDSERVELPNNIYHAKITTPFNIQNKAKAEKFATYSSTKKIFISEYNVYFLPTSIEQDSLVGKLFISVEKLNIDDEIERWSPIYKNVKMKINKRRTQSITTNQFWASLLLQLPNENWSAFFSRGGELFEIYSYSDYEKYMSEYINITLSKEEAIE
jgi:hypothetical protein